MSERIMGASLASVAAESARFCKDERCASNGAPPMGYLGGEVRRYHVTTFGCQMNAHDSERIKGLLEELGLGEAPSQEQADVIVLNTCTIREKPDTRFAAHMGNGAELKRERPGPGGAGGGRYGGAR